jgi:hypothetical protein
MSSRSLMHRVFPPSMPPDGGYPQSFRLVVGGSNSGSWYLSAIVRLQGFSSRSPVAPLRRRSPKTVTSSPWMGRSKPGCDLGPALSFKDVHHPCWGGERGEPGLYLPRRPAGHLFFQLLVVATILQLCGGGILQPCRGRRTVAAQLGCNIPPLPRFRGEDGNEDLPVHFGAARSLALMAGSRPLSGNANESLPVAASVLGPWLLLQRSLASHPELVAPQAPWCGGCSYPRGRNRSSVCNGTLNASVFVHCGCRGLNMYVILGTEPCFFLIFEH